MYRIRVQAILAREQIVSAIGGGFWRRLLPRFERLTITLLAVDGTTDQAAALSAAISNIPGLSEFLRVSVNGVQINPI